MADPDVSFSRGPARRPLPTLADPLFQWSTGLPTTARRIISGFLTEAGKNEALDRALIGAGYTTVQVRHGSGAVVTHWHIESASLFVIADGVQSIAEMKSTSERYGIAFGWRALPDGRPQSQLRLRAFVRELLAVGYIEPVLVSVKSTLTGDLLAALMQQYDVLDEIDVLRAQQGKPALLPPFYACSIPIGPGDEVQRGATQQKAIVPPVAHIPTPITRDYLVAQYIAREWVGLIEARIEETLRWSVATSAQIAAGVEATGEAE